MKTIYFAASSLDGFIADKNDSLEWLFKNGPTDLSFIEDIMKDVGSIAMGASTYLWLLENNKDPWPYKIPCLVFTHRKLPLIEGADIRFVQGDVGPHHRELVRLAGGKNVWLAGGGELVGQFHDQGLLDEMQIQTVAVFLNEGKKLFSRRTETAFKIKEINQRGDTCVDVVYTVK
ncbi:dihydrofolate reductase family protein [Bdellovibrio sp. HCB290]|uniref:dihydrofolate reductase family protein n=1 Tax=Bdellovibrio sp. HCB290 TaxID=3394356 RepID=UPI0039B6323A